MLADMQPWEWAGWQMYDQKNPIGPAKYDWLFAMLAKTVVDFSQSLDRKKFPQGVPLEEFLPAWAKPKPVKLTVDQSVAWVVGLAEMYGAIDLRGAQ